MKVQLHRIAQARSGDKGDGSNVGVLARSELAYAFLKEHLTTDVVRTHFGAINAEYATFFADEPPARATVEVSRLPMDVLVEIDCVARVRG